MVQQLARFSFEPLFIWTKQVITQCLPFLFLSMIMQKASQKDQAKEWTWPNNNSLQIWDGETTFYSLKNNGASPVAQWLRISLPMQGAQVRALVQEDPTCPGATKPVCHNYWSLRATTTDAHVPRARALWQQKPPQWEARAPPWRVAPAHRNVRKPVCSKEDPTQPKINT